MYTRARVCVYDNLPLAGNSLIILIVMWGIVENIFSSEFRILMFPKIWQSLTWQMIPLIFRTWRKSEE